MLYSTKSSTTKAQLWLRLSARPHLIRGASRFRGVRRYNSSTCFPWRAVLRFDGRSFDGGAYATEEEAALAWNQLALRIVGPEAQPRLNQVPDTPLHATTAKDD
jgi:hypothetical protein